MCIKGNCDLAKGGVDGKNSAVIGKLCVLLSETGQVLGEKKE
jgi:hypothetical protein